MVSQYYFQKNRYSFAPVSGLFGYNQFGSSQLWAVSPHWSSGDIQHGEPVSGSAVACPGPGCPQTTIGLLVTWGLIFIF